MRYRFAGPTETMIADLNGAVFQPDQEFDPADYGVPGWKPEPYPHPLFEEIASPKPVKASIPPKEQE